MSFVFEQTIRKHGFEKGPIQLDMATYKDCVKSMPFTKSLNDALVNATLGLIGELSELQEDDNDILELGDCWWYLVSVWTALVDTQEIGPLLGGPSKIDRDTAHRYAMEIAEVTKKVVYHNRAQSEFREKVRFNLIGIAKFLDWVSPIPRVDVLEANLCKLLDRYGYQLQSDALIVTIRQEGK